MVVNMEIGMITSPVGLNLFVTAGITGRSMGWAIRAALLWLAIVLAFLVIVTYVPEISLTLPNLIYQWRGISKKRAGAQSRRRHNKAATPLLAIC